MKNKRPGWLIDMMVFSLLSLVCFYFPFATYSYNGQTYTINGLDFAIGTRIMGGTVHVGPIVWLILCAICAVAIVILSVLSGRCSKKLIFKLMLIFNACIMLILIYFKVALEDILSEVKKYSLAYGYYLVTLLCIVMMVRVLHLLYLQKILSALDFFVLPGCIYLFINNYMPMIGIFLAFKKIDFRVGIFKSEWIGLQNFEYLFKTNDAWIMTRNTILYNVAFIVLSTVLGVAVGICLNEVAVKRLKKLYQTSILLPQMISIIIIAYITYAFLSNETGLINHLLGEEHAVDFYQDTTWWPLILTFVYLWKGLGYNSIIYLSAIVGIDQTLYEAAVVDGASKWKQIRYITVPMLKPVTITLILISVGRIFYSDFGLFYQVPMDSGSLFKVTQTIDTYVYRALLQNNNIAMAAAASVYQSVVGFVLILVANKIVSKVDADNALF